MNSNRRMILQSAAGLALVGALPVGLTGCGLLGGEEAKIEAVFQQFFVAFAKRDAAALAKLVQAPADLAARLGPSAAETVAQYITKLERYQGMSPDQLLAPGLRYHIFSTTITGDSAVVDFEFKRQPPTAMAFLRIEDHWLVDLGRRAESPEARRRMTTDNWKDGYQDPPGKPLMP